VSGTARLRIAVVAADPGRREPLVDLLDARPDLEVVAWADDLEGLLVLGTRADVCVCAEPPPAAPAERLTDRGCAVVPAGDDTVAAVRQAASRSPAGRPVLAPRQREVLLAYVSGNELLPTLARRLGIDHETLKTHLRRIRAKYAAAGRPAPTRRDLYVRAVEDGLLPPPRGRHWR
jgi:DNA-binding NarL/FixJ family response regulator